MGKPINIYYYGARYYNPRWSSLSASGGWLSVDPLADKYPHASPYNYCLNNPVIFVDPDGRQVGHYEDYEGNFLGYDQDGLNTSTVHYVQKASQVDLIKSNHAEGKTTDIDDIRDLGQVFSSAYFLNDNGDKKEASNDNATSLNEEKSNNAVSVFTIINSLKTSTLDEVVSNISAIKSYNTFWKSIGYGAGFYQLYETKNIENKVNRNAERLSVIIGNVPIPYIAIPWSVGWETGKKYGPSKWFGNNDEKWFE